MMDNKNKVGDTMSIAMGAVQLSLLVGSLGVLAYSFVALLRGNEEADIQ
jgi:hypothetical protein